MLKQIRNLLIRLHNWIGQKLHPEKAKREQEFIKSYGRLINSYRELRGKVYRKEQGPWYDIPLDDPAKPKKRSWVDFVLRRRRQQGREQENDLSAG